ncbi:MAG: oligosaccharide flippase family protein [Terriglobales bacterium]
MADTASAPAGMPTGAASLAGARRRVPWNVGANVAGLVINLALTVFITPLLVHGLGEVAFGIWALVGHIAGNMNLLDFGMQVTVTRYLAHHHALDDKEGISQVVSSALLFSLLPAAAALVAGAVVAWLAPAIFHLPAAYVTSGRAAILLVAASVALLFPGGVINSAIPALSRYDLLNLRNIFWSVARVALLWWVLTHGYGLVAVALVCLIAQALMLLLGAGLSFHLLPWLRLGRRFCRRATLRSLVSFSFWAFLISIASRLIFTADNVVVAVTLGPVAVAFYGIGSSIAEQLRGGMATVTMLYAPLAAQMHALHGESALALLLRRGTRIAVLISLPGILAMAAVGNPFLNFWLGADYAARTTPILVLLCLSAGIYALALTCNQVLYGMNRHRISAHISLAEASANLLLSILLALRLGAVGVAWGTFLPALLCEGIFLPVYTCRQVSVPLTTYYRDVLGRPLLAAVPMGLWLLWMRTHNLVQGWTSLAAWIVPGCALYLLSVWWVALDGEEKAMVTRRLRRAAHAGAGEAAS